MDRDDIIRMAREAGAMFDHRYWVERDLAPVFERFCLRHVDLLFVEFLHGFAALVAAAEREAIAKSLDKQADLACDEIDRQWAQEMAAAVRARGDNE